MPVWNSLLLRSAMASDQPDRLKLWTVVAIGATLTASIWLGVVEVGNARMNGLLQSLPQWSTQPWAYRYFDRDVFAEDYRQVAPDADEEQVNQAFAQELGRNHLYRLVLGFGTTAMVLACIGIGASLAVLLFRKGPVRMGLRMGIAFCGVVCLGVLLRCFYLGVLTHGAVTALVN